MLVPSMCCGLRHQSRTCRGNPWHLWGTSLSPGWWRVRSLWCWRRWHCEPKPRHWNEVYPSRDWWLHQNRQFFQVPRWGKGQECSQNKGPKAKENAEQPHLRYQYLGFYKSFECWNTVFLGEENDDLFLRVNRSMRFGWNPNQVDLNHQIPFVLCNVLSTTYRIHVLQYIYLPNVYFNYIIIYIPDIDLMGYSVFECLIQNTLMFWYLALRCVFLETYFISSKDV